MNIDFKIEMNFNKANAEWRRKKVKILEEIGLTANEIWGKIITLKDVVDTGAFRNKRNYVVKKHKNVVEVGSSVEYAEFLELGTVNKDGSVKMKARPTLEPALLDYREVYEDLTRIEMEK